MSSLFETIRVREGRIPLLAEHLARLEASCAALDLARPQDGLTDRVGASARAGELVVRVTLSEGGERIETRPVPEHGPMRVVFSATPHEPYPRKSTARDLFDTARAAAVAQGAAEALLFTGDGVLAEGCVTSVFFWASRALCTPSLDLGILPGIGRARVLDIARRAGITVREGAFRREELEGSPIFLVNAVRGVALTVMHGASSIRSDARTRLFIERFWS